MSLNTVIERLEQSPEYLRANWTLPAEDARFLYLLAKIGRFTNILEIGTSIGYSTLHLALAASQTQGKVTTIDASAERQNQAIQHLQEAELIDYVTPLLGEALPTLDQLCQEGQTFDLMFLDAQKAEYIDYLTRSEKLLRPGGILIADNTRSHRNSMLDFIGAITQSSAWEACDLDTSNGFVLARKREFAL